MTSGAGWLVVSWFVVGGLRLPGFARNDWAGRVGCGRVFGTGDIREFGDMGSILSNPSSLAIVMVFGIPIVVPTVAIIAHYCHKIMKVRSDNELKESMLERGMSAEEIERVINAGVRSKGGEEDEDD